VRNEIQTIPGSPYSGAEQICFVDRAIEEGFQNVFSLQTAGHQVALNVDSFEAEGFPTRGHPLQFDQYRHTLVSSLARAEQVQRWQQLPLHRRYVVREARLQNHDRQNVLQRRSLATQNSRIHSRNSQ
jgi:hypothetical protein